MKDHEGGFILENDFPLSPVTTGASDDNNISKWAARRIAKLEEQILAIHYHIATIRIDFEINSLKINGLPLNTIRAWVGNDAGPEILARYGFHAGSKVNNPVESEIRERVARTHMFRRGYRILPAWWFPSRCSYTSSPSI